MCSMDQAKHRHGREGGAHTWSTAGPGTPSLCHGHGSCRTWPCLHTLLPACLPPHMLRFTQSWRAVQARLEGDGRGAWCGKAGEVSQHPAFREAEGQGSNFSTKEREGDGTQQHASCSHLPPWPLTAGMVLCPQPACEHTARMAILRDQMGPAASQFSKPLPEAPKDPSIPHLTAHTPPSPFCHPLSCSSPGCLSSPQALISLPASHLASSFPGASQAGWQPTAAAPSRAAVPRPPFTPPF